MATIFHDDDADLAVLAGASVAVVGYGNQGRSWALNLRDSGFDVQVCVRADASREQAVADGFTPGELADASDADVVCVLIPDDVIPSLPLRGRADGLTIVASGYTLAFDRFAPDGDIGMVAPRMLGPEVRTLLRGGHRLHHRGRRAPRRHRARRRRGRSRSRRRSAGCARVRSSSRRARRRSSTSAVEQVLRADR